MHRKFDKNAQLSNQLKTWDNSIKIIDKLLAIARSADISRVFFFYLKVFFFVNWVWFCEVIDFNSLFFLEHTPLHQTIFAIWNDDHWIELATKSRWYRFVFAVIAKFHEVLAQFMRTFEGDCDFVTSDSPSLFKKLSIRTNKYKFEIVGHQRHSDHCINSAVAWDARSIGIQSESSISGKQLLIWFLGRQFEK